MSLSTTKKIAGGIAGAALIAGLVLVPTTGADFSASDAGDISGSTATLSLDLSGTGDYETFNFNYAGLAPGDTQSQTFSVKNTGSIAADASFRLVNQHFSAGPADLSLLTIGTDQIAPVSLNSLDKQSFDLGEIEPGEVIVVNLRIGLDQSAGNDWQGVSFSGDGLVTLNQR